MPSRLFIYYNERMIENDVENDDGAQIRDGIKSINQCGICDEIIWKYDIQKFTEKPTEECYIEGQKCHTLKYSRVQQSINEIKYVLNNGFPIVFGFMVFESFETPEVSKSGMMPHPQPYENMLGGHAVVMIGYDDSLESLEGDKGMFIVRNSWGSSWGKSGYFFMPYKFVMNSNYVSDLWVITSITNPIDI